MKKIEAIQKLRAWDQKGRYVFTKRDLEKLFVSDDTHSLKQSLKRLVKDQLLIRACRGIYVNPLATSADAYTIERIAKALRRGEYNYVSLESMLIEYGAISQLLLDRLTIMTTGRSGCYITAYGVIEFTHTKRSSHDILDNTINIENRPLRIASKQTAWRDLKRVGRNTNMVDEEMINNDE